MVSLSALSVSLVWVGFAGPSHAASSMVMSKKQMLLIFFILGYSSVFILIFLGELFCSAKSSGASDLSFLLAG